MDALTFISFSDPLLLLYVATINLTTICHIIQYRWFIPTYVHHKTNEKRSFSQVQRTYEKLPI